jgi:sortase A
MALPETPEPVATAPTPAADNRSDPAAAEPGPAPLSDPGPDPTEEPPPQPHAEPVRVMIPRIGVNARVIPVGEAADGSMDSPNDPVDVGWWDLGSRPGDHGSTVLGGHVDFAGYGAAVFWNLKLLHPGDQVTVLSSDNSRWVFTVNEVATYSYTDTSVLDRIFRSADHEGLNLITCTGTFDPRSHNYDQRVVVYTSLRGS